MRVLALRFNHVVITAFIIIVIAHTFLNAITLEFISQFEGKKEQRTGDYNCLTVFIGFYG